MKEIKKKTDELAKRDKEDEQFAQLYDLMSMFQDETNVYIFNAGYDNDFYTD